MLKLQITNYKSQTNPKSKITMTKALNCVCDFAIRYCILFVICLLCIVILPHTAYCLSLKDAQKEYIYGNYQEAIRKVHLLKPTDETLYFLGLAYIKVGDYPRAQIYLNKLIKRYPSSRFNSQGMVKLADTYFLQGDYNHARKLYSEITRKYPALNNIPTVYLRLAQIASRQGDWAGKRQYLKLIQDRYPQSSEMKFVKTLKDYGDFFTIQVGAFSERKNALALSQELKKDYSTYIVNDTKGNFSLYKVRVGKFKSRYDVEKVATQLRNKGYPSRIYP